MLSPSIILKSQLEGAKRLDAEYYQPEYLNFDNLINRFKKFKISEIADVVYGTTPEGANFVDSGVPFIRSQNFDMSIINEDDLVHCSKKFHGKNKKSSIASGDILFAAVGATIGELAIVQNSIEDGNINQNIAKIRINNREVSPYFVWIFFNSKMGQYQIERLITGNAQPYLNSEQIKEFIIPKIKRQDLFQKYFKDICFEAEKSKLLYHQAEKLLLEELDLENFGGQNDSLFTIINLSEAKKVVRLDPEYFNSDVNKLLDKIKKISKPVGDLVSIKKGIEPGAEEYKETGKQFIRVSSLSKYGINDSDQKCLSEELYQKLKDDFQPKKGEILLTKDASPGITYVLKEDIDGIVSGGILRLKIKDKSVEDEYLALCLNSIVGQIQAERDAGGSVIKHWKPEQIKQAMIPILPKPAQEKISSLIRESFVAREKAKELLDEAKRKVEEMIEKEE